MLILLRAKVGASCETCNGPVCLGDIVGRYVESSTALMKLESQPSVHFGCVMAWLITRPNLCITETVTDGLAHSIDNEKS